MRKEIWFHEDYCCIISALWEASNGCKALADGDKNPDVQRTTVHNNNPKPETIHTIQSDMVVTRPSNRTIELQYQEHVATKRAWKKSFRIGLQKPDDTASIALLKPAHPWHQALQWKEHSQPRWEHKHKSSVEERTHNFIAKTCKTQFPHWNEVSKFARDRIYDSDYTKANSTKMSKTK